MFGAVILEVVRSLAKRNSSGESVCQMRVSESKATLAEVVVNGWKDCVHRVIVRE